MALKRELGLLDVFCIAAGAMISSGLFILPGLAYAKSGPAMVLAYILAGVLVVPSLFAKAELATAMPKAGGVYFFIERSMGAGAGTVGGIASWFSLSLKSAFALVGMGAFAVLINPNITFAQIKLIAVGCCGFFMVLNMIGVKHAGRSQVFLVLFLLALLGYYVFGGLGAVQPQRYIPFMPFGAGSVVATAGLVFISFGGLTKICCAAEEIKNPARNIPLGMFFAFSIVMIFYALVVFTTIGLVDGQKLSNSLTPISLGASAFAGLAGSAILAIAAILAFVSTANAGILTASRDALAMSRDGLLPGFFQKIHSKFGTPYVSIFFTTLFMVVVILFLTLENLVKVASTMKILLFMLANLSLIIMRRSKIQNYQPKFRAPLYPYLQISGIVGSSFLLSQMGKTPLLLTSIFIGGGLIWYWVYARGLTRKSALIHIVERVTDRELATDSLGSELKGILRERDNIILDRFDHIIEKCEILDLSGSMGIEEFLKLVSDKLSPRLAIKSEKLFELFVQREKESTTVLHPGIAFPHVIIKGTHKFEILLARCKEGIDFPGAISPVQIVFVLAASGDERNFYLRALMAIAQIIQQPDFEKGWLNARTLEELRDIILLAERKRAEV